MVSGQWSVVSGQLSLEGVERGSYQDNRPFVKIARGSLNETQH
ncbi:hypothetical protein [Argonema antarcticum]|nr:hypothetical protein [Argonema antarcticum]